MSMMTKYYEFCGFIKKKQKFKYFEKETFALQIIHYAIIRGYIWQKSNP